jgi:hypothetical protein
LIIDCHFLLPPIGISPTMSSIALKYNACRYQDMALQNSSAGR